MARPQQLFKPRQVRTTGGAAAPGVPGSDPAAAQPEFTSLAVQDTPLSLKIKAVQQLLQRSSDRKQHHDFLSGRTKYLFDVGRGRPVRILIGSAPGEQRYCVEPRVMDAVSRALNPEYAPQLTIDSTAPGLEPVVGLPEYNLAKNIVFDDVQEADHVNKVNEANKVNEVNEEALPESIVKSFGLQVDSKAKTALFAADTSALEQGGLFGYSHELPKLHMVAGSVSAAVGAIEIDDALDEEDDDDDANGAEHRSKRVKAARGEQKIDNELKRMTDLE